MYDVGASGINCALPENKNGHYFDLFKRMSLEFLKIPSAPKPLLNGYYCPSVKKKILDLICNSCGLYFVTKSSIKQHSKVHTNKPITNVPTATNGQDSEPEVVVESEDIFIIEDIDMWWAPEFVEKSANKISD
ncbi:unnamed protein product [Allacma fusca]|uniref:C2H2-type domain-containing protein n=1 Tax=Allacma fusca TaxID=39272 RepID=A0A8J2LK94_9HEXA|nr:unnamed protein product [Allacma fusca]